ELRGGAGAKFPGEFPASSPLVPRARVPGPVSAATRGRGRMFPLHFLAASRPHGERTSARVGPELQARIPRRPAMMILEALERFLVQLEADGRSPHTVGQYRRHVVRFAPWAALVNAG